MTKWYYVENGERVGPVEESDLESLIKTGTLNSDGYVWKKGFDNWVKLQDVEELTHLLNIVDDEPPVMNAMPPVIDEVEAKEFSWDSLKNTDKVISIKIGLDRGSDQVEYGPYTLNELKKSYDENRINDKTLVFIPGMKEWIFLAETPIYENVFGGLPPAIDEVEKRSNDRKPFVARMFFHDSKDVFEGVCRDISIGGMQILVSNLPCQEGDEISLNVHPDNDNYHFVATGLVVRTLNGNQGFALRFIDLSDEAERAISSYVQEN
ncbi:MAG: hypothetical protein BM556_07400 [Bacteriovorax sp. MedPE-SWde]|mgnify:FL=1|nr:MAG: hypothetical protein BM556_07400 [Bacteriovorax sp. MedPE-SWde]